MNEESPRFFESVNFDGLYIPPEIWNDKSLSLNEKMLLALYEKYEEPTVKRLYLVAHSARAYRMARKSLIDKKYITPIKFKMTEEELKRITIEKSHKGFICEWCGHESYVLQKHHYPIPRKNGGTETVNICPNCHYTYHSLIENE